MRVAGVGSPVREPARRVNSDHGDGNGEGGRLLGEYNGRCSPRTVFPKSQSMPLPSA